MTTKDTAFISWDLQGKLFLHDQIQQAIVRKNLRQKDADYHLAPGLTVKDECSRAFRIAQASWDIFRRANKSAKTVVDAENAAKAFAKNFFSEALGYKEWIIPQERMLVADGRGFAIHAFANGLPVSIVSGAVTLDQPLSELQIENGSRSRKTAFQNVQEFLNASQEHRWGFCFNGHAVRLVRDAMSLTRPSYLEFNLDEIFTTQGFADFLQLWAILHASRAEVEKGDTVWDMWIHAGEENGRPVREKLAAHVTQALHVLGNGFLKEPSNQALRDAISSGKLSAEDYVHELLRLMYRFLFVFCLEERGLINIKVDEESQDADSVCEAIARYHAGYALHRFRELSTKNRLRTRYTDAWDGVKIVFRSLAKGESSLALPALGGLFAENVTPWLDQCRLSNKSFLEAMELLRWATFDNVTTVIDYKNMGTEELGSVYEGLLQLVPYIDPADRSFGFVGLTNADNDRKSSGSYYTPDPLVQSLIKTALDPVIAEAIERNSQDPVKALLELRVIDPTCGSGHFLLAAARRIAEAVAQHQSVDGVVTPEAYREALRNVIQHCIYGVDINPLAIELARMALWLEGFSQGKPLSFLDHHLKVGNSILGVGEFSQLDYGISNKAFNNKKAGDDEGVCAELLKRNKEGLLYLENILQSEKNDNEPSLFSESSTVETIDWIESLESESILDEQRKENAYNELRQTLSQSLQKQKCDLYMAGYLCPKTVETAYCVPTTETMVRLRNGELEQKDRIVLEYATKFCEENKIFHWPLEFEGVFAQGGFDCVLGNPPWEKAKIEDDKWFAVRYPDIANAEKKAIREKMIDALSRGRLGFEYKGLPLSDDVERAEKALYKQYAEAKRQAAVAAVYGHLSEDEGGRFPLTGTGDTNLYAYVSELMINIRKTSGTVGVVVPPGLVTDDAYKNFAQKMLNGEISSFYQFDNTEKYFPIDNRCLYSLTTFRKSEKMECVFYASNVKHLEDADRKVEFEEGDFRRFNPNTGTCLFVRTREDLALIRKMYTAAPVFWKLEGGEENPWGVNTIAAFHMTNDDELFYKEKVCSNLVPLYEGKLIHQFDNRFSSCKGKIDSKEVGVPEEVTDEEKERWDFVVTPRYWISSSEVDKKLDKCSWLKPWKVVVRAVASPTNQRTVIASILPSSYGVGNSLLTILPEVEDEEAACLLANLNSLALDFVDRIKQPSGNFNMFVLRQLPVLPPSSYSKSERDFVAERVAKLTKNGCDVNDIWLRRYNCEKWQKPEERLRLRAELDAFFMLKYGLDRDDVRYILDPAEIYGANFPSVSFPGLRDDEIKRYGEYLTKRFVLEAYDQLVSARKTSGNVTC